MKKLILLLFLAFIFTSTKAQKGQTKKPFVFSKGYKSSWGVGCSFYAFNGIYEKIGSINYAPQLDLTNKRSDFSISLNTQLSAGYHFKSKNDSSNFPYADIPLFIEANFGHLASKDFYNEIGYFIGGGYDLNFLKNTLQHGPAFTAGMRTWFFGKSLTIRYIVSVPSPNSLLGTLIHTVSINLNVGSYLENVKANNKISNFLD